MSAIFCKKFAFFGKNSTFTQSYSVTALLESFEFSFQFLYNKRLLLIKIQDLYTMHSESGFQIAPNWP